jgi:hypothetical protein
MLFNFTNTDTSDHSQLSTRDMAAVDLAQSVHAYPIHLQTAHVDSVSA